MSIVYSVTMLHSLYKSQFQTKLPSVAQCGESVTPHWNRCEICAFTWNGNHDCMDSYGNDWILPTNIHRTIVNVTAPLDKGHRPCWSDLRWPAKCVTTADGCGSCCSRRSPLSSADWTCAAGAQRPARPWTPHIANVQSQLEMEQSLEFTKISSDILPSNTLSACSCLCALTWVGRVSQSRGPFGVAVT